LESNKSILIISESIDINDSSGSKVNIALIKNLYKVGYQIKVLHYTRKEIKLDNIECINIKEKKGILYVLSRTQRIIQRLLKVNLSKFLENLFGHSFTFFNDSKSIAKAIKKYHTNEDLIITLSKGASFRPHHALLSLPSLQQKWVAFIHDPYPFHYYPKPYDWVESGYKYKEQFFREVSEKAKFSVFPSKLLKEWMGNFYPNFLKTGIVIPHQTFEETVNNVSIPQYFDVNKFNILHAGNLMKQRSPKGLIEGFRLFLKNNSKAKNDSRLLLLGNADYHKKILDAYNTETKELYISSENVPFNEVFYLQKNVSVNIILESKSDISPFLPGKFPHCVTANKPILLLAPQKSETRRLLGRDYPYVAEVDNNKEIARFLEELYFVWENNPNDLKLNRKDLVDYISPKYLKEQIDSIL